MRAANLLVTNSTLGSILWRVVERFRYVWERIKRSPPILSARYLSGFLKYLCCSCLPSAAAVFLLVSNAGPAEAANDHQVKSDSDLPVEISYRLGQPFIVAGRMTQNEKYIITLGGGNDYNLKVWDSVSLALLRTIKLPERTPGNFAVLSGERVAVPSTASNDVIIIDLISGKKIDSLHFFTAYLMYIDVSQDGDTLIGCGFFACDVFSLSKKKVVFTFPGQHAKFIDNENVLVTLVNDKKAASGIAMINVATKKIVKKFERLPSYYGTADISRNGKIVALVAEDMRSVEVWSLAEQRVLRTFAAKKAIYGVSISSDGELVVGVEDRQIQKDGTYDSEAGGNAYIWEVKSGKTLSTIAFSDSVGLYARPMLQSGRVALFGTGGSFLLANARGDITQNVQSAFKGGRLVYGGPNYLTAQFPDYKERVGNFLSDEQRKRREDFIKFYNSAGKQEERQVVRWTWDSRFVAVADIKPDHVKIRHFSIYDAVKNIEIFSHDQLTQFNNFEFDFQSRYFVFENNETVSLFNLESKQSTVLGKIQTVYGPHFVGLSGDGSVAYANDPDAGKIYFWNTMDGKLENVIALTADELKLSPDGKTFVARRTGTLSIFDRYSGASKLVLEDSAWEGNDLSYSPNGDKIISRDPVLQLWNAQSGKQIASAWVASDERWIVMTPEGFFDATKNGLEDLRVVRGLTAYSLDQVYDTLHRPDLVREKFSGDREGKFRNAAQGLDLSKVLASGGAPEATLMPLASASTDLDKVTVEVKITDGGGGLGRVEWKVNGVTQGLDNPGSDSSKDTTFRRQLQLNPGENAIEVLAYNKLGTISSNRARLVLTRTSASNSRPRLYVLAVGVNEYWDSRLRLAFAVPDARAIADAFMRAGNEIYERVEVVTALDEQATQKGLEHEFSDLAQKIRPQDAFVFFLSGHGKTIDGRFYFIPQDFRYKGEDSIVATAIGQVELQRWFATIPAQKSVLLFDACESGSLTEDNYKGVGRGMEELTALDRLTHAMGRTVLTATTDDKPAAEGIGGHGVFTYALLEAIGEAQADPDGLIGVNELASFVDRSVPELSYSAWKIRQVPQMRIVGSNFPLVKKIAVLDSKASAAVEFVPTRPTHVVIIQTSARDVPSDTANIGSDLSPGTQVRVIEITGDWARIARDGKRIGFVPAKALVSLH